MIKIAGVFAVAAVLALPFAAEADVLGTVEIEHNGYGAKSLIKVWGGGYNGVSRFAGVYMFNKSDGSGEGEELWDNGPLGAFCIELPQDVPYNPTTYNVVMPEEAQEPPEFLGGPIGAAKAGYLAELWDRFFDPSWVGKAPFTGQQKSDAGAFAAAVWEIIYEDLPASPGGWDVTTDGTDEGGPLGFRAERVDDVLANSWLHALDGSSSADLRAFINAEKQDYLVEVPIPEPATLLVLLGLGGLALLRRRRG